jgi:hypothetical protein
MQNMYMEILLNQMSFNGNTLESSYKWLNLPIAIRSINWYNIYKNSLLKIIYHSRDIQLFVVRNFKIIKYHGYCFIVIKLKRC